jgi:CubicO group peptidase (beta-lactamase class C family)
MKKSPALLTCALALAFRALAAPAPSPFPDTPEGRRLAAFFAAADQQDEKATRAFIEQNFPPEALKELPLEQRLKNIHGFISRNGPFDVVRALPPRPGSAGAVARSRRTGEVFQISLELEESPRRGVLRLRVEQGAGEDEPEPPAAKPAANDDELGRTVDAAATELSGKDAFSGVVLLARGGRVFFQKAWGMADRGLSVPNRVDTKFNIGSIGKAFTRAAVMDLVKAGRFSLSDTVKKLLPETRIPSADRITLEMLLEMTSGLGDIFGDKYDATPKDRLRTLEDFLPLFETTPLRFAPGTGRAYSNAGYVVLGLVIERVSGKPYWDFVRERVLLPAGMKDTGPFGPDDVVANRAVGYTKSEGGAWRSNVYALPGRASSAGGVYSTAPDLLAFAGTGAGALAIAGGTAGANAVLEAGRQGLTVIVLVNMDPPVAERLARRIRAWAPAGDQERRTP